MFSSFCALLLSVPLANYHFNGFDFKLKLEFNSPPSAPRLLSCLGCSFISFLLSSAYSAKSQLNCILSCHSSSSGDLVSLFSSTLNLFRMHLVLWLMVCLETLSIHCCSLPTNYKPSLTSRCHSLGHDRQSRPAAKQLVPGRQRQDNRINPRSKLCKRNILSDRSSPRRCITLMGNYTNADDLYEK